ncbi:MAG: hypothetical protein Q4C95_01230 [Planctomycetia bacterium]|nr:hypothetical protein [Planctomycetia bacterium]
MDFNFFQWIREGVKRSVLLGVSDAVQQMGMPHDEASNKDKILSFLQDETSSTTRRRLSSSTSGTTRKLGRSINDIHPTN